MHKDLGWDEKDIVVQPVQLTAVFANNGGGITILQQDSLGGDYSVVTISADCAERVAEAIKRVAAEIGGRDAKTNA